MSKSPTVVFTLSIFLTTWPKNAISNITCGPIPVVSELVGTLRKFSLFYQANAHVNMFLLPSGAMGTNVVAISVFRLLPYLHITRIKYWLIAGVMNETCVFHIYGMRIFEIFRRASGGTSANVVRDLHMLDIGDSRILVSLPIKVLSVHLDMLCYIDTGE